MSKGILRIITFIFCFAILASSLSSCKNQEKEVDSTTKSNEYVEEISDLTSDINDNKDDKVEIKNEDENFSETKDSETNNQTTKSSKITTTKATTIKNISLTSGLTSSNKKEVLKYYKLVASKNSELKIHKSLSLTSLNIGNVTIDGKNDPEKLEKGTNIFITLAKAALKLSSGNVKFPGNPSAIKESDWISAKAVNDGKYTTLNIKVVPQTDGANGKEFEGSVGRSMQVLPGFEYALAELKSMTADFKNGDVKIEYLNPTITIKVENATGKLVKDSCRWYYSTHPVFNKLNATMKVVKVHDIYIENSDGYIDYILTY